MAVGRKKSKSKKGHRRGGNTSAPQLQLGIDGTTGEAKIRHFVTDSGFYRGKKVIQDKE